MLTKSKRNLTLTILFVVFCFSSTGPAQQDKPADAIQTAKSFNVTSKLEYLLYLPNGYQPDAKDKPWPLIVFLHGAGERGANLNKVKIWGPPKLVEQGKELPFVVVSPQCPKGIYWNLDHLNQLVDGVIAENNIDKDRVYLTGLSMGGFGTWGLASLYPEKFAAAAPVCGSGDPELASQLIELPIWAFHGDQDKVVPISGSQEVVDAIKEAGGKKVKFTIYEGVGHNSWTETYANQELYEWFLQHKRKPAK